MANKGETVDDLKQKLAYKMRNLRPKQRKFLRAYIKTGRAGQSCVDAGYSPKSASTHANRMMKKDNPVKEAYDLAMQIEALEHGIPLSHKRAWIMQALEKAQSDEFYSASGVKGLIELLAKLDQDKMTPNTEININQLPIMKIVTNAPEPAKVIDSQKVSELPGLADAENQVKSSPHPANIPQVDHSIKHKADIDQDTGADSGKSFKDDS